MTGATAAAVGFGVFSFSHAFMGLTPETAVIDQMHAMWTVLGIAWNAACGMTSRTFTNRPTVSLNLGGSQIVICIRIFNWPLGMGRAMTALT